MPLRKTQLISGEIYHIYNRGVDKRDIFMDEQDHFRFIHDLYEFNDKNSSIVLNNYLKKMINKKSLEVGLPKIQRQEREKLVEILAYCLMNNHFHLLVRQKEENGITTFMRKMGTGYTNYFNKKYERSGVLFQGNFKSVHLEKDSHFLYLPVYIHFNPLDLEFKEWREGKIKNHKKALEFLDNYRWSSYMDYTGKKNFPSILDKDFLMETFGNEEKYKKEIENWLKSFKEISDKNSLKNLILE